MKTFYHLLGTALIAITTNSFVWFAVTFWVFLETKNVISTSVIAGIFLVMTASSGFWLGSIVDHNKKKNAMLGSSIASLIFFVIGFLIYTNTPPSDFRSVTSPVLWVFSVAILFGSIAGNIYNIAIPTLVTVLVPEKKRDKANGLFGSVMGVAFALTSVASAFILALGGMNAVLITAIVSTLIAFVYLSFIHIPEKHPIHAQHIQEQSTPIKTQQGEQQKKIDIKGTIKAIKDIPGLFALIIFNAFNNFLGGVFMALMDAYGLTLVSLQTWGVMWGVLSLGFIAGGLLIARTGLGANPIKTLFRINIAMWVICIFFTIQASIVLLFVGMMIYMILIPFVEATEQTIIQKVVPHERQGRVFGFAQSVEQSASPLTAFMIGPIAQLIFIPFMTTGAGVELIGGWFGTGFGRGIALVFILTGLIGLIVTLIAMRSPSYKLLAARYLKR